MQLNEVLLNLLFDLYGVSFILLGVILWMIRPPPQAYFISRHLAWLAAFGILHGLAAFLSGESIRGLSAWINNSIIIFFWAIYLVMFEFGRRHWNDNPAFGLLIKARVLYPLLMTLFGVIVVAGFTAETPLASPDFAIRSVLGVPAMALATWVSLRAANSAGTQFAPVQDRPYLRILAGTFVILGIMVLPMAYVYPGYSWVPNVVQFREFFGFPLQFIRAICALVILGVYVLLIRRNTGLLFAEHARIKASIANEAKYRTLFEASPDALMILDKHGFVDVNLSTEKMFGISKAGLLEHQVHTLSPPTQENGELSEVLVRKLAMRTFEQGPQKFNWLYKRANGEVFPAEVELTAMPMLGPNVLLGIVRDQTSEVATQTRILIKDEAINSSPTATVLASLDGQITYVNQALLGLWGLESIGEVLGRALMDLLAVAEQVPADLLKQVKLKGQWSGEGQIRYLGEACALSSVNITLHLVKDPKGKPLCFMGTFVDISAYQKVTVALRRERDFATQLLNTAPIIVVVLDNQGNVEFVNAYFEKLSDYKLSEIKGENWFLTMLPAEIRENIKQLFIDSIEHHVPTRGNINSIVLKNGELRDIEWFDDLLPDETGKSARLMAIGRDVTMQKVAEQAVRQSQARLNDAQRVAKLGSWEFDAVTQVISWSEEIFRIFEIANTEEPASVTDLLSLVHPHDRRKLRELMEEAVANHEPMLTTCRFLMADGRVKYISWHAHHEYHLDGTHLKTVGTLQDISEQHQAEQELRQHREHLQELVRERTQDMFREKLNAERANAAKSEFLSRMSHELRTPLNAILGFTQLLQLQGKHHTAQVKDEYIQSILDAGLHLLSLVNDLLDLSRIESGHLSLSIEKVQMEEAVERSVNQLIPLANQFNITLKVVPVPDIFVRADHTRLRQVLINLMTNAIKYNHSGGRVLVDYQQTSTDRIRVQVADNGPGISEADLGLLFQPFERLDYKNSSIEGTGIGLVLSKYLVEAMHGTIGVESSVGAGSSFWFELPIAKSLPEAAMVSQQEQNLPLSQLRKKVLYVEDNPANLSLIKHYFELFPNLELLTATEGNSGLELAFSCQPDLILLDINLPGMNGYEILAALRSNPVTRNLPIIAVTANAMPEEMSKGEMSGFDAYLVKPLELAEFLQLLRKYLGLL